MKETMNPTRKPGVLAVAITLLSLLLVLIVPGSAKAAGPDGIKATVLGADAIQVTWTKASGVSYVVEYWKGPDAHAQVKTTEGYANLTGLATTTYSVKVGIVAGGSTSWSSTLTATTKNLYSAPTGLTKNNVGSTMVELSWTGVTGAGGYIARCTSSGKPTLYASTLSTTVQVKDMTKATTYSCSVAVQAPATTTYPPMPAVRQSSYSSATSVVTLNNELPAPTDLKVVKQDAYEATLSWTAPVGMKSTYVYKVYYALDAAMTDTKLSKVGTSTPQLTITGLKANTNYYARVLVIDSTSGAVKSDQSDYVQVKTLVPRGTLKGQVNLGGASYRDVVVEAYNGTELVEQVNVASDGSYSIKIRTGAYKVRAEYIGTGSFTSPWAQTGSSGVPVPSAASSITVDRNQTSTAPSISLRTGAQFSGVIKDSAGQPISAVDVTLLTAMTSEREVAAQAMTAGDGSYTIKGLADGTHYLRAIYSSDGFQTRSIEVRVQDARVVYVRPTDIDTPLTGSFTTINTYLKNADFRKTYGAYVQGTYKVGNTVNCYATAWLAGSYPTTRASMSITWLRDGKYVSSGWTRKLTSSDKGHKIACKAKAERYGYNTGYVTSSSKTIY